MSSVEDENQAIEGYSAFVPMEENGSAEDPQVNVTVLDEAAEEGAVCIEEHELAAADRDLSNPFVFNMASREVDEGYMSVIRGLNTFDHEDEEVCRNAVDICKDIIAVEQSLFSEAPSYVTYFMSAQRAKAIAYNKTVQPHMTLPTANGATCNWEEQRAYVDPSVPLLLPYDAERFKLERAERTPAEGTYHNLFYGDGTQVVFSAPPDNKRRQLEEEHKKHPHPSYHGPYIFKPQHKKPMRVPADFVPSCAVAENSRSASRNKRMSMTKTKKQNKKKVITK
ncbi:hypothetical protein Q4I28_004452 [Leishmania naiffi]|uniref:Uncharacterized protein n=1 Tax=Leishmania naiffi TaxID=5678 RepID=A0AAW3BMS8_9TRYP